MGKFQLMILTALVIGFSFCTKDVGRPAPVEPVDNSLPDQIVYTDISPDFTISVSNNTKDSAFYYLDVDSDSIYDYYFSARTYSLNSGTSPSFPYWESRITAFGTSSLNLVTNGNILYTLSGNSFCVDQGAVIDEKTLGIPGLNKLIYYMSDSHQALFFSVDKYFPIKFSNKYYGWIKLANPGLEPRIVVKEIAVNKTAGNSIKAGQTQ